ncbi:hypothetical protein ACFW1F_36055 [Streptomyces bungoensis]|uniref:hypothetical protein n=1 Tax=Streptomyces bungoensis TaxID=285568 RepID=UPI0036ADBAE7
MHQKDLAAIGSAAHELFQDFGRYGDEARLSSMKAAGGLRGEGFALGAALDHVAEHWIEQVQTLLDACAHISDHLRFTENQHAADESYIAGALSSISELDKGWTVRPMPSRPPTSWRGWPSARTRCPPRTSPRSTTLQFWTDIVNAHAGARGSELDSMEDMQRNLSMTLATASFSDSDDMKAWKSGLLREMNTSFLSESKTPFQNPVGALGSQVLSSLMRQGKFDTEFLDDYRTRLFKQDKGAGDSNTDALWVKGYDHIDLVFGDGNGRDPLEGLFDALSHNPEAATHAFESKSDLDHMLGSTVYTGRGESLGRALESAVTGVANGETSSMAPPHSAAQVKIWPTS